ncbi:MAG: hypothetical protein KGI06_00725 [Candidatus Micrarchaeota archaeon]|nr:hypothetical protein [Candidatus Micrarchaeota archaeon]
MVMVNKKGNGLGRLVTHKDDDVESFLNATDVIEVKVLLRGQNYVFKKEEGEGNKWIRYSVDTEGNLVSTRSDC